MAPASATTPAPRTSVRTAWLWFAPPAALAGLRQLLAWQTERGAQAPRLALAPFAGAQNPWAWLATLGWAALVLALLGLLAWQAHRRWGVRALQRALAGAWVLACLAGAAALLQRHANVQGAQPLAPVAAQVLGSRAQAASARSTGGTLLVLRIEGLAPAQQLLLDDPQAAHWRPGQRLQLQWARGRFGGHFVTGWQALPAPAPVSVSGPGPMGQSALL